MDMKLLKSLAIILFGCCVMAFGIINFAVVNQLASGGFTGITLILFQLFGISTGLSSFLMNIPALLVFYRFVNKRTFFLTIYGIVSLSLSLSFFEWLGPIVPSLQDDMLLAAAGFGIVVGVGTAIVLKADGTTGGAAIIAKLLNELFHIPIAKVFLVFDTVVILCSLFFFVTFIDAIYSLIALIFMSIAITKYMEGFIGGYQVLIVSEEYRTITKMIHSEMMRGVTLLDGTGAYSNFDKKIVLCAIPKKELVALKKIIYEVDPKSFVTVGHIYETLGEGFTFEKKLPNK